MLRVDKRISVVRNQWMQHNVNMSKQSESHTCYKSGQLFLPLVFMRRGAKENVVVEDEESVKEKVRTMPRLTEGAN